MVDGYRVIVLYQVVRCACFVCLCIVTLGKGNTRILLLQKEERKRRVNGPFEKHGFRELTAT